LKRSCALLMKRCHDQTIRKCRYKQNGIGLRRAYSEPAVPYRPKHKRSSRLQKFSLKDAFRKPEAQGTDD
ncbi:MAG: hypothetical protein MUO37_03805, partial [Methyloceanibacter sp.]|nr:hypothetical protein [Methyloceanibacter sp.]